MNVGPCRNSAGKRRKTGVKPESHGIGQKCAYKIDEKHVIFVVVVVVEQTANNCRGRNLGFVRFINSFMN